MMGGEPLDDGDGDGAAAVDASSPTDAELRTRIDTLQERIDELEAAVEADDADAPTKLTIVATQGTFDMAYPPLILASTAAAFGWDVVVFHTFWGLDILHEEKSKKLKLSAVGNPNMPMPNALAALPGMDRLATYMMENRIADNGTATVEELIELSIDSGVDLQVCGMTADLMGYAAEDFYDGVTLDVGAATALQHMAESDVQLLV